MQPIVCWLGASGLISPAFFGQKARFDGGNTAAAVTHYDPPKPRENMPLSQGGTPHHDWVVEQLTPGAKSLRERVTRANVTNVSLMFEPSSEALLPNRLKALQALPATTHQPHGVPSDLL